jgi:hypothetical protein
LQLSRTGGRYVSFLHKTAHAIRTNLFASATIATFWWVRAISWSNQQRSPGGCLLRYCITVRAPWTNSFRRYTLPRLPRGPFWNMGVKGKGARHVQVQGDVTRVVAKSGVHKTSSEKNEFPARSAGELTEMAQRSIRRFLNLISEEVIRDRMANREESGRNPSWPGVADSTKGRIH